MWESRKQLLGSAAGEASYPGEELTPLAGRGQLLLRVSLQIQRLQGGPLSLGQHTASRGQLRFVSVFLSA